MAGHTPGETLMSRSQFPDRYGDTTDAEGNTTTLSNQKAGASPVTLNYISETVLPTLNDEWVDASFGATDAYPHRGRPGGTVQRAAHRCQY